MKYTLISLLFIGFINCQNNDSQKSQPPLHRSPNGQYQVVTEPVLNKIKDITLPEGYKREVYVKGSFQAYLQNLPLKSDKTVYLYNGEKKTNQDAQYAVLDISVSKRDLQQCADAIMRLRAEYYFQNKMYKNIAFNAVEGTPMRYIDWANGARNLLKINALAKEMKPDADLSYASFLKYMDFVFAYASTLSLENELTPLSNSMEMKVGDVFIKGGSPGHAVLVVDMAVHEKTKSKIFLLAQSYMPAQDIHILKNPNANMSPWYALPIQNQLITPEWVFKSNELKGF